MRERSRGCYASLGCAMALTVALGLGSPSPVQAGRHVRVVLDTSGSMKKTDQPRLAPLATLLLYDLAALEVTLDDSFAVLPFHPTQKWNPPTGPAPTGTGRPIVPTGGNRSALASELQSLPYEANWTYFYPGLKRAIEDLESTPGGARDVRVVVLVTDGLPEDETRDQELRTLQEELVPRMEKQGIRFYVLAFGPLASQNQGFFDKLVDPPGSSRLGRLFVDPDGSGMLGHMTQIFSQGFGYTQKNVGPVPGVDNLDLEGGTTPDRVAVVVFSRRPAPPRLRLRPPPGGDVNAPEGVRSGKESGASYSLIWVLSPHAGPYSLRSDLKAGDRGRVALLRPTRLELELLPVAPMTQIGRAMAGEAFPLEVLVKPAAGARGDPGAVNISYQVFGPRQRGSTGGYEWETSPQAPPATSGKLTPKGRSFPIRVTFPEARQEEPGGESFIGHIEVEARRQGSDAVVATRSGHRAQRIEVYPHLAIHPRPTVGDARVLQSRSSGSVALTRGDEGCARFTLETEAERLPHPDSPHYPLRAALADSVRLDGALAEATFTLDGLPLEVDGRSGPSPGEWYRGRSLERDRFLGEHTLCLRVGKPTVGAISTPQRIPLALTFDESPYDQFDVIESFILVARIAPPTFVEKWTSALLLGGAALLILGSLWYLRFRPTLPEDLRVDLVRTDSVRSARGDKIRPGRRSLPSRLLGLVGEHPVESADDGRLVGYLRPVDRELFRFRPARGLRMAAPDGSRPASPGTTDLVVHRSYHLQSDEIGYAMRLEYEG